MQFRSLHSLARTLAAGAASALALTLFNAAQPTLRPHRIGPGAVKDVPITLVPTAVDPGAVDTREHAASGSATLPLRGAEPRAGSMNAAQGRRLGPAPGR